MKETFRGADKTYQPSVVTNTTTSTLEENRSIIYADLKSGKFNVSQDIPLVITGLNVDELYETIHTTAKRKALREVIATLKTKYKYVQSMEGSMYDRALDDIITHLESELTI